MRPHEGGIFLAYTAYRSSLGPGKKLLLGVFIQMQMLILDTFFASIYSTWNVGKEREHTLRCPIE